MTLTRLRLSVFAAAASTLCASAQESSSSRGAELLAPFKQQLQHALREGLAKGPDTAIAVCQDKAPKIAAAQSKDGVEMGRASDRLRNSSNSPPEWAAPILQSYLDTPSERVPRTVEISADRHGYVEPIIAQPLCLTCHGKALSPDIAERIEKLYPDDQAVGYEAGDLRGLFWVEYPSDKQGQAVF